MNEIIFTHQDFIDFRKWVNLNLDGLTWQGRFKKEFENFWDVFFEDNLSLKKIHDRFLYAEQEAKIGTVSSWFKWLKEKFLNYVYIFKDLSIDEISYQTGMGLSETATIVRNFLVDEYPHLDSFLSDAFQVGNILSPNVHRKFSTIKNEMQVPIPQIGSREDEVMPSMEITLFEGWNSFIRKMKTDFNSTGFNLHDLTEKTNFVKQLKILQHVGVLLLTFTILIYGVRQFNVWYEKNLMDKVSIYEPKFNWFTKELFKGQEAKPAKEFKLNFDEIKDITKGEKLTEFFDPEKYEEETEVSLSSFDSLPKDFKDVDKEASAYEGDSESPNGYRETKNGTTKIYRLMMTASNTYDVRTKINDLVKKYQIEPVGDSTPGQDVPGGVYFNVYVPKKDFKDFMGQTMGISSSKLFESSTSNVKNVPGKVRVFIMVKSI